MKKIQKGKPGYLNYKRKVEILRTVIYFVIVLAIFALGYWQTHTRLNLLTVVAILGCLPASKALVGLRHFLVCQCFASEVSALCAKDFESQYAQ